MSLFAANSTRELTIIDIRLAWQRTTDSFYRVEKSPILSTTASIIFFSITINTDKLSSPREKIMSRHQVTTVFQVPSWVALVPSWYHNLRAAWRHVTDGARCVVVVKGPRIEKIIWVLILDSTDVIYSLNLLRIIVYSPYRLQRQANVVRAASAVGIILPTNDT